MKSVLETALEVAGQDRSRDYGHPWDNHVRIANLWNAYLENRGTLVQLEPEDVACMMILLKIAREQNTHKQDNLIDVAGYVRCLEMIIEKRQSSDASLGSGGHEQPCTDRTGT